MDSLSLLSRLALWRVVDRNWTFVEKTLKDCVDCPGYLRTVTGQAVDTSKVPAAGDYKFVRTGSLHR